MPEVKVPELAESITEGTIAEWLKQVGDSVDKGEAIVELETDKVNVEVVSEEAGVLQELLANEGDTVEVGQAIAVVGEGSGNNTSEAPAKQEAPKQETETSTDDKSAQPAESTSNDADDKSQDNNQRVNATPSARKYAREKGIDLSEIAAASNDVVRKNMLIKAKLKQALNNKHNRLLKKKRKNQHNKIHQNL